MELTCKQVTLMFLDSPFGAQWCWSSASTWRIICGRTTRRGRRLTSISCPLLSCSTRSLEKESRLGRWVQNICIYNCTLTQVYSKQRVAVPVVPAVLVTETYSPAPFGEEWRTTGADMCFRGPLIFLCTRPQPSPSRAQIHAAYCNCSEVTVTNSWLQ